MKLFCSLILFITALFTTVTAQQSSLVYPATQRIFEEKTRGLDIAALIQWQKAHPGEPLPGYLWSTLHTTSERSNESVVSANAEAESEVHAAINPADSTNIIVAGIIQDPNNFLSPLDIPVRYTKNFGQTWQNTTVKFNPSSGGFSIVAGGGDPVIAFDKSGKAYISWLVLTIDLLSTPPVTLALYASTSTNKGQTWSAPILIDKGSIDLDVLTGGGSGAGDLVDKQWMAVDQSSSNFEGQLYVSYTRFEIIDSTNSTAQILVKTKAKNAAAFSTNAVQIHTGTYSLVQFSSIAVDPAGTVHVTFFGGNDAGDLALYYTQSTNGGISFSPEKKVSNIHFPSLVGGAVTDSIAGITSDRLYPCPHISVGKTLGTLYATWTSNGINGAETPGFDVWLSKSGNNGGTWSAPKRVNPGTDNTADQFYAASAVNASGALCLSYYDRTDNPGGTITNYVLAVSTDEGVTFKPSVVVSNIPSDFSQIGTLNGGFGIGEYTQVVCSPNYAIPVWADGRTNDGNIELYAAFVPLTALISSTNDWGALTDEITVTVPNPASEIVLNMAIKTSTSVQIRIFTEDGRLVASDLSQDQLSPGNYKKRFVVPAGQYLCMIQTNKGMRAKKVIIR